MPRLVQLQNGRKRRIAMVDEPHLRLLSGVESVCALANQAIARSSPLEALVHERLTDETLDYDAVYELRSDWHLLPPLDHPDEPARCLVSGTGLTHMGSAKNRDAMHNASEAQLTDSMRMFQWGVEGGKPALEIRDEPTRAGVDFQQTVNGLGFESGG